METDKLKIYRHDFPPLQDSSLLKLLRKHLPHSIVLLRRITLYPPTAAGVVLLATFPQDASSHPKEFMTAFVDREILPNSEAFTFSSLEIREQLSAQHGQQHDDSLARRQLLTLLSQTASIPIPPSRAQYSPSPNIVFLGALHSSLAEILRSCPGVVQPSMHGGGPYTKYIWRVSSQLPADEVNFDGLEWDEAYDEDKQLIAESNPLVRRKSQLEGLPCSGLRPTVMTTASEKRPALVSWAILSQDGSVRSLHTQPGYRGRGLAKKVAAMIVKREWPRLMQRSGGMDLQKNGDGDTDDWLHADVAPDNIASIKTFQALGAKPVDERFWIRIDAGKITGMLGS